MLPEFSFCEFFTNAPVFFHGDTSSVAARVRGIYDKYLPKETLESEDKEIEQSKLLSQYVSDADKKEIRALNESREN